MEEIKKDLEKYSALSSLKDSEGGKILIEALESDCRSTIDELRIKCRELTHIEMVGLCLKLNEKLNILRILNNSQKNRDLVKEEFDKIAG
jgi:hypothetical protein